MSTVRMCDKCGRIFSEREEGWQTGQVWTKKKGQDREAAVTLDQCVNCAVGGLEDNPPAPHLALPEPKAPNVVDAVPAAPATTTG